MKNYDQLMGEAYQRGYHVGVLAQEMKAETGDLGEIPEALSGEWAGESIPELFGLDIGEQYDASIVSDYENQYADGFAAGLVHDEE